MIQSASIVFALDFFVAWLVTLLCDWLLEVCEVSMVSDGNAELLFLRSVLIVNHPDDEWISARCEIGTWIESELVTRYRTVLFYFE